MLFADDTNLFYSNKNLVKLTDTVNAELKKASAWFRSNKLSLNVKKTNYMFFGNNRRKCNSNMSLVIDSTAILETSSAKLLGVIMDSGLTWKSHVDYLKTKIAKGLGIMNRV